LKDKNVPEGCQGIIKKTQPMNKRPYHMDSDLKLLQDFNAAALAETDGCGYLHPGDIPHRLFNGNKFFDPAEVMTIWEDDDGVAAWVLTSARFKSFDAQVHPDMRGGDFEREVLMYANAQTVAQMRLHNIEGENYSVDVYQCDPHRSKLLSELGWELEAQSTYVLTRASLEDVDEPVLPEGYKIRAVSGIEEATAVAGVHLATFPKAGWTPELYQQVMESPGYASERELVVIGPDGTFVAFALTWYDELNKIGYLEPVGTHKDYRQRGLGKAVVLYGMRQMAANGMRYASVAHFSNNEAAQGLYTACGFKTWHKLDDYSKSFSKE
jgi:ribosomal protein S18 acetylase RimI-like enzyme